MKNWLASVMIVLGLVAAVNVEARARIVPLPETYELFFAEEGRVSMADIRGIIKSAMSRSSVRRVEWVKVKDMPGKYIVEVSRGRINALIDIKYNSKGISLEYNDSERMGYRERSGKEYINVMYTQWIRRFSDNLTTISRRMVGIELLSKRQYEIKKGIDSGKFAIAVAAYAIPGNTPRTYKSKWSTDIINTVADSLTEASQGRGVTLPLEWNRETQRLAKGAHKRGYNIEGCDNTGANGIVSVRAEIDDEGSSGASLDVSFTFFNCDTEKLISKNYVIDASNSDSFDYENGFNKAAIQFARDFGIFQ